MDLGFFIVWLALFILRKDTRKVMLFISIPLGILGLFFNIIYIKDWWMPLTVTGTIPAIEDFLYGFTIGGISAVIYEEIFKKKIIIKRESKRIKRKEIFNFWKAGIASIITFYIIYYFLKINTFYISAIIFIIIILTICIKRKDLIPHAIGSGICLLIVAFIVHSITNIITPGWIEAFWYFDIVPKLIILNVPLEDILFYFLFGAAVGPLYEYWQEGKLIKAS